MGVRASAGECFEVRVGCTKRAEVSRGVGSRVRSSYSTSAKLRLERRPGASQAEMDLGAQ